MSDLLLDHKEWALERFRREYKRDPTPQEFTEYFNKQEESFYGEIDGFETYCEGMY